MNNQDSHSHCGTDGEQVTLCPRIKLYVLLRQPGDGKLQPIEDAPGSYIKARAIK
jgi:hypothetical protein